MSLSNVKKELNKFDKKKLIDLITELYKNNRSVKEYLDFFANPDEKQLSEIYKEKVLQAFYPKRGFELKLRDAKTAISDFKKLGPSTELLADIMLFYVECGVRFTNDYGDIDEPFYSSLEKMYEKTLSFIKSEDLLDKFHDRSLKIVNDTQDIGWGFHDNLVDQHYEYYPYKE